MYELVKKILDVAKEKGVDVGVAYDLIANETGYTEELKAAHKTLDAEYEAITALRNKGKEAEIKVICDMREKGNITGADDYIKALINEGVI